MSQKFITLKYIANLFAVHLIHSINIIHYHLCKTYPGDVAMNIVSHIITCPHPINNFHLQTLYQYTTSINSVNIMLINIHHISARLYKLNLRLVLYHQSIFTFRVSTVR